METLTQAHGKWVSGDSFWDRTQDITLLQRLIEEGANILLVGQRRMGKTSLLKEVACRMEDCYTFVFVDLQEARSPQDAIAQLSAALHPHKTIWNRAREVFANVMDRVEKIGVDELEVTLRGGLDAGNWAAKGDRLFGILAESDRPVVLLLDEVPILLNRLLKGGGFTVSPEGRQSADVFMSWLRKNSIAHQGKVRIVITGSIGLEPVLKQANLSATVNNFSSVELGPWDDQAAISCLDALARHYGIRFHDGAQLTMVRCLGCAIPHHVQMFFAHAYDYATRRKSMDLYPADIKEVYETRMLSARGHVELSHYEERLKMVIGTDKLPLAIEMLSEAAVTGVLNSHALVALQQEYQFDGDTTANVQLEILRILEHDGYLARRDNGYVFVSQFLRDWWKNSHEMFYLPVSQRGPAHA
jgi:hypothetical protein